MGETKKSGREKPKVGRPKIKIDWGLVERLAKIQCTEEEIAYAIGVERHTLASRPEFSTIYKKGRMEGRISLRRAQAKKAFEGNTTMQVWLGKQWLGQTDKQEQTITQTPERIIYKEADGKDD